MAIEGDQSRPHQLLDRIGPERRIAICSLTFIQLKAAVIPVAVLVPTVTAKASAPARYTSASESRSRASSGPRSRRAPHRTATRDHPDEHIMVATGSSDAELKYLVGDVKQADGRRGPQTSACPSITAMPPRKDPALIVRPRARPLRARCSFQVRVVLVGWWTHRRNGYEKPRRPSRAHRCVDRGPGPRRR
jgi:hypothetical protein